MMNSICKSMKLTLATLCLLVGCGLVRAEITDRMLAIVNGQLITESDVVWALALDPEVQPLDLGQENKRLMLERLIDQKLLDQEAEKTPQNEPTEDEITNYIKELVTKFRAEETFRERMQKVGLDQASLREIARHRLEILKYVEFRFRSFAFVKPEEVERYYNETWLPRIKASGGQARSLDDTLREEISHILEEQKANAELDHFFDEARANAQVIRLAQL
ncbi:MAG: hypothetical protein U0Z53_14100 [Blastocatellia bacterium]